MNTLYFELAALAFLVCFGCWMTFLTMRIFETVAIINQSDDQLIEIQQSVELVAQILNKLPELMPQFTMNSNPLQPIIEAFARKFSGEPALRTLQTSQVHGEGEQQEQQHPSPPE